MGGRTEIFVFLSSEDVQSHQVDFGMAVLAGLGGRRFDNPAGTVLDDDKTVPSEGRALHGEGERSASVGVLEGILVLFVGHCGSVMDATVQMK